MPAAAGMEVAQVARECLAAPWAQVENGRAVVAVGSHTVNVQATSQWARQEAMVPLLLRPGRPRHLLLLVVLHASRALSPAARQAATLHPAVCAVQATKPRQMIPQEQLLVASAHKIHTRKTLEQDYATRVHCMKPRSASLGQSHQ